MSDRYLVTLNGGIPLDRSRTEADAQLLILSNWTHRTCHLRQVSSDDPVAERGWVVTFQYPNITVHHFGVQITDEQMWPPFAVTFTRAIRRTTNQEFVPA